VLVSREAGTSALIPLTLTAASSNRVEGPRHNRERCIK